MRSHYYDGSKMSLRKHAGQPSLPFGEGWLSKPTPPARRKSKLMFVLKPSAPLGLVMHGDAMIHAANENTRDAHPADLLHMSLLCMEQFEEPPMPLIEATKMVAASLQARPVPVTLDSSALFGGKRHLALYRARGNPVAVQFAQMLRRALARHNLPNYWMADTTPHVTLIYGCGRIEPMPIERNYAWIAGEFMLVYSHYGETRHEEFGRWSFDPNAPAYPTRPEQLRMMI
ncbi:2'-5' RNA ligase [Neorhizobium galegae bv. orientalis]|nr:2'-5' RNA ligase [Neorhizobium galegae]CDZ58043.1 2'-5' RNA ligase [Neorhizobium galegae bv. orientalis]CDZ68708.1 2'-5' RNA ligase [Neorhizobium galegae bv. orientalis]